MAALFCVEMKGLVNIVWNNDWLNISSAFKNYSKVYVFTLIMWTGWSAEKTEVYIKD